MSHRFNVHIDVCLKQQSLTSRVAVPVLVQDLNNLMSAFTAKPWRYGCAHLFAFIFRTRAAAAYNQHTNSIMRPCCTSKAAPQAPAAIVAASIQVAKSQKSSRHLTVGVLLTQIARPACMEMIMS